MHDLRYLRIPLSVLESFEELDAFTGLDAPQLQAMDEDYTADERANLVAALAFAVHHPDYDFAALMPGLQVPNARIQPFLAKLYHSMTSGAGADS